jgi:hypothetical protein
MGILGEAAEILGTLLLERGPDDPTFRRMLRWYGEVAAELECQELYDRLVAAILARSRKKEAS